MARAALAAPTWQDVLASLPPGGADVIRWLAGSDDEAARAAWQSWVAQATALTPAPLLICPAARR